MRIITGIYKGKFIVMPKGIRPTQNVVRKAVFDILGDIEGLSFLELFAGSGAVGLEAKSRGVSELVFVESNRECILALNKNIEALKVKDCSLYPRQAEEAIKDLYKQQRKFDLVFLDPPYYQDLTKKTLQTLGACDILSPNGLIVVQHFKKDPLPDTLGDLNLLRQSKYGATLLSILGKISRNSSQES